MIATPERRGAQHGDEVVSGTEEPITRPGSHTSSGCLGIDLSHFWLEMGNDLPDVYAPVLLASKFPSPSPVYAYLDHNAVINAEASALMQFIHHL